VHFDEFRTAFDDLLGRLEAAGDPRLAERLVANLVDNALRHNVPGGHVEVVTGSGAGGSVLTVINTGPVVPAEAVGRLLQPFQRLGADRTGHDEGLGLGLSIVQAIAQAHGAALVIRPSRPAGCGPRSPFPASPLRQATVTRPRFRTNRA
jgi:signal transduction histidine kinase